MADEPNTTSTDESVQAFENLRGEMSLVRRAVEGLTAERERAPDYSPTLGEMSEALRAARASIERIEAGPVAKLSPEGLALEILKASDTARAQDKQMLREAARALSQATGQVDGIVKRGQCADKQRHRSIYAGAIGLASGILLWSILPGAIARSLPASWHIPEWMAARMMGMDQHTAGRRLTKVALPAVEQ